MGRGHFGRLALADDYSCERRHRQHSVEPSGSARGRGVGSGQGRGRRRAVQGLWSAWPDARTHPHAHFMARRQHIEGRNRLRHADASAPLRERRGPAGTAELAGCHRRRMDRAWRWPRQPAVRHAQDRDDESASRDTCGRTASPTASGRCSRSTGTCMRCRTATDCWSTRTWSTTRSTSSSPFQTAIHYKLERDASKWDPTPCDARF